MIIHSYLTNGFVDYAKLFLESFKYHNGEKYKMVLTTRDVGKKHRDEFRSIYNNIDIINGHIDYELIAKRTGFSVEEIKRYKHQVEQSSITFKMKKPLRWKQYISIEDRYRNSIVEVMEKYKGKEDYLIHFDSDMYIREPLDFLFDLVQKNDFTIMFRLNRGPEWQKIFGCLLGIKIDEKGFKFMETWRKHIDAYPLNKKPDGYGQTSCYYAYRDLKDDGYKWGNIPEKYIARRMNKKKPIWSGNNVAYGKTRALQMSREDFDKIKKRGKKSNG